MNLSPTEIQRIIDALEYHFNGINSEEHDINKSIADKFKIDSSLHEEYSHRMSALINDTGDVEANHSNADKILCDLLSNLGYTDIVYDFKRLRKWYA